MDAATFARRIRSGEPSVGYWVVTDSPVATERIAHLDCDFVCLDAQHGLIGTTGIVAGLMAVSAGGRAAGIVRVEANDPTPIGRALDAGAVGVIVPFVETAADAAAAVAAARYPPVGRRSYGPNRSGMRIGPRAAEADATVLVIAMIETQEGLDNVEAICATPGLDGVYVGPSDLTLALGGGFPGDPAVQERFDAAVEAVRTVALAAGLAVGMHTRDGDSAARALSQGFTFVSLANDLAHLEQAAAAHLAAARQKDTT